VSMRIEYSQQSSAQQISRPCTPEARKSPRVVDCGRVIIETSAIDEEAAPFNKSPMIFCIVGWFEVQAKASLNPPTFAAP
jgi:hypothetical protein